MSGLLVFVVLNALLILLISPLFMGIIKKVKALMQGRRGPPLLQQYYSLLKLLRKETVVSATASWITPFTPYLNVAVLVIATAFVPIFFAPQPNATVGNIILFIYLLALAKFFMALSGLDAGSTFGGMGSSREMALSAMLEPLAMLVFVAFAFVFKSSNFFEIIHQTSTAGIFTINPVIILLAVALFVVLIAETSRVPVDNPETHLELTMIHEAMVLEYSGKHLALMEFAHAIKQTLLMAIFINIVVPYGFATSTTGLSLAIGAASFIAKGIVLCIAVGVIESSVAKLRLFRVPGMIMVAIFLAFLTIVVEVFR